MKPRPPIQRARASCRNGHVVAERLFDPGETSAHQALMRLQIESSSWCPACGVVEIFYTALPTRYYSLSAATAELESVRN